MVTRRIADVFQIVMLAVGAHATLRSYRANVGTLFLAQKTILELVHAGIGEQQRWVVFGNQRTGRHVGVAFGDEKIDKGLTNA